MRNRGLQNVVMRIEFGLEAAQFAKLCSETTEGSATEALDAARRAGVRCFDAASHPGLNLSRGRLRHLLTGRHRDGPDYFGHATSTACTGYGKRRTRQRVLPATACHHVALPQGAPAHPLLHLIAVSNVGARTAEKVDANVDRHTTQASPHSRSTSRPIVGA
jgi:aryl-alcohol dehydrogenase-like predicted oxidoreductase